MVLVGQVKARMTTATIRDASSEVLMTLIQEERSGVSAGVLVVGSLFMTTSKQNACFVYGIELYSRF